MRATHPLLALALAASLAACGGNNEAVEASDDGAAAMADAGDEPIATDDAPADPGANELTPARLDAVARGLASENAQLQSLLERVGEAEGPAARDAVLAEMDLQELQAQAASDAGLSPDEYLWLRDEVFEVLGDLEVRELVLSGYRDAEAGDEASAAVIRQQRDALMADLPDPLAGLAPEAAEALRARQAELATLRTENIALLFKIIGA